MSAREKKITVFVLGTILLVSLGLHLYRIDYPNQPVFDETYFATQSADYIEHIPFVDLHPPLGKLLYAGVLVLTGKPIHDAQFVKVQWNEQMNGTEAVYDPARTYGDFPYAALRVFCALFGVALVLVFYFFLRSLGIPNVGAVLGAGLIAFDSALLVETRLILLNGIYLTFGLAALTFYFKKSSRGGSASGGKPWPIVSGVLLAMALGVKMVAVVFIPPLLIYRYLMSQEGERKKEYKRSLTKLFTVAIIVYLMIFSLTNLFFSAQEQYDVLARLHLVSQDFAHDALPPVLNKFSARVLLFLVEEKVAFANYLGGTLSDVSSSPWYLWPLGQIPMDYYKIGSHAVRLVGNPVVWFAGTAAVLLAFAIAHRFLRRKKSAHYGVPQKTAFLVLLGGYVFALLPFIAFIRRTTYLYHYFPALLFSIGLFVWFLCDKFRFDNFSNLTKRQGIVLGVVSFLAIIGFLLNAKFVYGF